MTQIFSLPINPKLTQSQFEYFAGFINHHKHLIYDLYFTCRIAPFDQDAMGDVFAEDPSITTETALWFKNTFGVKISATFNNIQVPPTQQNLDLWIKNFAPLWEAGVDTVTLPHTHWVATGQIQKAFPGIFIKNTILRDVNSASEIVNLAKAGFDYINIDRDLMRDRDALLRLKQAKEWVKKNLGKTLVFSLLANEGCLGKCPMMVEHFEYNNTRVFGQPQYFTDTISRVSCPKWDYEDPSVQLKTASFPPWKADWEEFFDLGIDVFKMHGRESTNRMFESLNIIHKWNTNHEILFDDFKQYIEDKNLIDKPINVWRNKIKNCKFDCWECQYCDKIYAKKASVQESTLVQSIVTAVAESGSNELVLDIPGLTSPRVQALLNKFAKHSKNYLEVGSYLGATTCAVLSNNSINVACVDMWKEQIQPARDDMTLPPNNKEAFITNVKKYKGDNTVKVYDCDMFSVNLDQLSEIDFFFYDGPHDTETTAKAVEYFYPAFAKETILVFDDANWGGVVKGADLGISKTDLKIKYSKILLNLPENHDEWWNGLYILIVEKGN